jgi:hypothetical protein
MAQILPFTRRRDVFEPAATAAMGQAYDEAFATIDPTAEPQFVVRELIAKRILRTSLLGRDQLYKSALSGISPVEDWPESMSYRAYE